MTETLNRLKSEIGVRMDAHSTRVESLSSSLSKLESFVKVLASETAEQSSASSIDPQVLADSVSAYLDDPDSAISRALASLDPDSYHRSDTGLGIPDYALESAGAGILPAHTSATYCLAFSSSSNCRALGLPARTALHPDLNAGRCWSMQGNHG